MEKDKYLKSLLCALNQSIGQYRDRGTALPTSPCRLENINPNRASTWEAGGLLQAMSEMKVLPEDEVKRIRATLSNREITVPRKPPAPSTRGGDNTRGTVTAFAGAISSVQRSKRKEQDDSINVSSSNRQGPPAFLPPRRFAPGVTNEDPVNSQNEYGQGQTSISGSDFRHPAATSSSLFARLSGPPCKKPAVESSIMAGSGSNRGFINPRIPPSTSGEKPEPSFSGGPTFKTAMDQLKINDKLKGIYRKLPPPGGNNNMRVPGLFRAPEKPAPPAPPAGRDSEEAPANPEVAELMTHEYMKNIDPKMVEAILNEVIQVATTDWNDIAGLDGVKRTIQEIILWPLERPDIFKGLRASPRGILFFGPPGTGKTMFGRVIATRSKSTFFNISASSLTSKWIGDGEKMVRALFAVARVKQPSVIFIDEIDSILTARSDTEHESSRRLKTEFLIQFDGCGTQSEDRVLVIGVTNRPQELDDAARRRLVKRIYIPLPDIDGRKQLVKNLLKEYSCSLTEENYVEIAQMTEGYSGADMNSLCREAAYGPIRELGDLLYSISENQVRPMEMKDFATAQQQVKSSVAANDVKLYEDWDSKFGCNIRKVDL